MHRSNPLTPARFNIPVDTWSRFQILLVRKSSPMRPLRPDELPDLHRAEERPLANLVSLTDLSVSVFKKGKGGDPDLALGVFCEEQKQDLAVGDYAPGSDVPGSASIELQWERGLNRPLTLFCYTNKIRYTRSFEFRSYQDFARASLKVYVPAGGIEFDLDELGIIPPGYSGGPGLAIHGFTKRKCLKEDIYACFDVTLPATVNASEKVIRFSRFRPEPGIQGEPRSTGTR